MARPTTDRERVEDQKRKLQDREYGRRLMQHLAARRQRGMKEPDRARAVGMDRVPIELRRPSRRPGDFVMVAKGEVLVQLDGEPGETLVSLLARYQLKPADTKYRGVIRVVPSGDRPRVDEAVRALRDEGFRASLNHISALSGRMKGQSTPEYTDHPLASRSLLAEPEVRPLIVVIDTGLDEQAAARGDGWLDGITPLPEDIDPLDLLDRNGSLTPDGFLDWGAGHGTFVAGVVRQIAPAARVEVLRALDTDGIGSEASVCDAIQRAAAIFADNGNRGVLNLSLGEETVDDDPPVVMESALAALPEGVIVVAAAGNTGDTTKVWPAAFDGVLAVAGLDMDGGPSTWSTRGDWVDFSARGEGVVSTFVKGTETMGSGMPGDPYDDDPETFPRDGQDESYALWTGTSFAAPQVAAWLAQYLTDHQRASPEGAKAALRALGTPVNDFGHAVEIRLPR